MIFGVTAGAFTYLVTRVAFHADLSESTVKVNLCGFWLPALPSPFWVCALVSMGSGEYFPLNSFSVMVPVGGCMQEWFLHAALTWIPPAMPEVIRLLPNL